MKMRLLATAVAAALGLAAAAQSAQAAAFGASLVVVQDGDGAAALTNAATPAFLDEFSLGGGSIQSIALPTATSGANFALTLSGTAASEGFLTKSVDGRYLNLAGYNATPGTTPITSAVASTIQRVVGRIDLSGNVDTTTALNDNVNLGNPRSVVADGSNIWVATSAQGIRYTTYGTVGASTQISSTPTNTRVVNIFNGQLYTTSASTVFQGVCTVGTGEPTTTGQTTTALQGFPTASGPSPYDYIFADSNTLYVADDRSTGAGGIQKWIQSGGTWTLQYTMAPTATTGLRGLTGYADGAGNFIFYGTTSESSANKLVTITDAIAATALAGQTFTTLATAPTNTAFRGVELVPEPATASLLMFGAAGLLTRRSRRRA